MDGVNTNKTTPQPGGPIDHRSTKRNISFSLLVVCALVWLMYVY